MKSANHPVAEATVSALLPPERVHVLLERLVVVYQRAFEASPAAQECLRNCGLTAPEAWAEHRIGYSDGKLRELLPSDGPVLADLSALGVLLENAQECLAGCLVFPVRDAEGCVVTLIGHAIGSPKSPDVFLKGIPARIWNAAAAKIYSHLVAVTSVLDALHLERIGFRNVVAVPEGDVAPEDLALFRRHGVQRITAIVPNAELAPGKDQFPTGALREFRCEVRVLPANHDLSSYLRTFGAQGLTELISANRASEPVGEQKTQPEQALPDGFVLQLGLRRYEVRGLEKGSHKLKATVRVEHAGKLHVDTLDFYSAKARRQLAQDIAPLFEASGEAISAEVTKLMEACERHNPDLAGVLLPPVPIMKPEARAAAEALGQNPQLLERIKTDFERSGLVGEQVNALLCYLALTSRKMEKPLSVLILSSSGAGKSALQDTALLFCPPEDLVKVTSLSGQALFYKEPGSLKHKVLALEEGEGMRKATYALRNLISAGELVIETTTKEPGTGKLVTMGNKVEGPTAVFITTTNPGTDAETKSRFFVTGIDESRDQTRAILAAQRQRDTLTGERTQRDVDHVLRIHRDFQRLLRPVAVVNPYADQLTYGDDRLQSRRDQPKYLNLIRTIAFLRQMQKPIQTWTGSDGARDYVEVEPEDIRVANDLICDLLGHSLDELSRPGYDLLLLLEEMVRKSPNSKSFSRREIREFSGWTNARVHRYVRELIELEYVLVENGRNGLPHQYRLMYEGQGKDGQKFVLGLRPIEALQPRPLA